MKKINIVSDTSVLDDCIKKIESILAVITLVEHDRTFIPRGSIVEFGAETEALRETLLTLYRKIRHRKVTELEVNEVDEDIEQIFVIYKPHLTQYAEYIQSNSLT